MFVADLAEVMSVVGVCVTGWIRFRPNANRVALMLRLMYGCSFWNCCGATWNRSTAAGTSPPTTIETTPSSPIAMTGSAQPAEADVHQEQDRAREAMKTSSFSAGSCAWMSVYEAPVTTPRADTSRSNLPR